MKSRKYKYTPQPSTLDQLMNSIGQISALAAVSGYGAIVSSLAAISIIVLSSAIIFPTWFRSDPTGLIEGNPLDVVLGDGLATFNSTGFSAVCPSGELNFCDFVTATNNHFTMIDERLNTTNGSSISASSVGYNGSTPYYTVPVFNLGAAVDDLSTRYYEAVFNISLTASRFPALSFPTDQETIDEDIGRRLRIIETAPNVTTVTTLPATNISYPPAVPSNWSPAPDNLQTAEDQLAARVKTLESTPVATNITSLPAGNITYTPSSPTNWSPAPTELQTAEDQLAARVKTLESTPGATNITTLPAVNITYTPSNSSNWSPAPTELQTAEDQLASRVKALESAMDVDDAYTTTFNGSSPQFPNNDANVGSALNFLGKSVLELMAQTTQLLTRKNLNIYVSAAYGNDGTGDGSASLPVQSLWRAMQLVPNTTNQFLKYSIVFDNGLYVETNFIAFKPNIILSGNEIGTLIILDAGAGLDGSAWTSSGTGFVSILRFGLIRCNAACNFDMGAAAPGIDIFAGFSAYNTSFQLNAPMTFARGITGNPYLGVSFESVGVTGADIIFNDLTGLTWSLSSDSYSNIVVNYTSSTTFNGFTPIISMNGLVNRGSIGVHNYASGLLVDWSITNVINRDAATLTRHYVSGASINVHADILTLGVINGGMVSSGAGSGSTQHLTLAPGLGYTPTTSSDWSIVPTNQQQANDYLASHVRTLELAGRTVMSFSANTTTSFAIPSSVQIVFIFGCGGGSSGAGNNPGLAHGGNAGAGVIDVPITNTGSNFTITVGIGGASAAAPASNPGTDTSISNNITTIVLEGGTAVTGSNRGGNVIFNTEIIIAGSAGAGTPGVNANFNGGMYGGAGGGSNQVAADGYAGGLTPLLQPRALGGVISGNSQGGGGGSSIFGTGGAGGSGLVTASNGFPGGLCAGGGGGGTDPSNPANGGAGGNGVFYLWF